MGPINYNQIIFDNLKLLKESLENSNLEEKDFKIAAYDKVINNIHKDESGRYMNSLRPVYSIDDLYIDENGVRKFIGGKKIMKRIQLIMDTNDYLEEVKEYLVKKETNQEVDTSQCIRNIQIINDIENYVLYLDMTRPQPKAMMKELETLKLEYTNMLKEHWEN
jgi:hypothetical protein